MLGGARKDSQFILAHDLGTSGAKSSLVSVDGRIVASQSQAYQTARPDARAREQDPTDWWTAIVSNTRRLLSDRGRTEIVAMGVSGHMLGLVLVESSGEPLLPAMIHSDTRATAEEAMLRSEVGDIEFHRITGNRLDARASLAKLLWVQKHRPQVYRRTHRALQSKDYIVGRLVGRYETTDYSDASHGSFLDVARGDYAHDLLTRLSIDPSVFPALHAGTDVAGELSKDAAADLGLPEGVPVVVGAGDGSSASVGAGSVAPGASYCCLGTTAWIAVCGGDPIGDPRAFNIMSAGGPSCDWFATIQSAGAALAWSIDVLNISGHDQIDRLVRGIAPGSEGLLFLPYLDGERSPIWDPSARGVWFGLSSRHTTGHLIRSVLEGVGFALKSVFEVMRSHASIDELRLIGGGFRSQLWRRMIADILEVPLHTVRVPAEDATALGAALVAAVGIGVYPDLTATADCVPVNLTVSPGPECGAYEDSYRRFLELYPAVKPQFTRIDDVS